MAWAGWTRGVLEPLPAGPGAGRADRLHDALPPWSQGFTEHDWHIVGQWDPEWSLTDVLANFDSCDLFARFLVENGAARGTYHAALFGYCFLNDVHYLDGSAEPSRLTVQAMFDAAYRHLEPSFEHFAAQMHDLSRSHLARRSVRLAVAAGGFSWHGELPHADELSAVLAGAPGALAAAFRARAGEPAVVASGPLGSVALGYRPPAFELTVRLDEAAVAAGNAAALDGLRLDRDTCCYLQLDELVVLHGPQDWADPVLGVLWLCCRQRHGAPQPGLVERVGRLAPDPDRFVVWSPPGPDPAVVRAMVAHRHAPTGHVLVRPLR